MEETLRQLWTLCLWYFGINTTVAVGLFSWLIKIQSKLSLGETITSDLKKLQLDIDEIKIALKGDWDKKGLMNRFLDLENRINTQEKKGDFYGH